MGARKKLDVTSLSFALQFRVVSQIIKEYVLKNKRMRILLLPYFLLVILTKSAQIKAVNLMSTHFDNLKSHQYDKNIENLVAIFGLTYFYIFAGELISFAFVPFIQNCLRIANRECFEHFMSLEHGQFRKIGSGEIHSSVERRSTAVADILDVVLIEIFPIITTLVFSTANIIYLTNFTNGVILVGAVAILLVTTVKITNFRTVLRREANRKANKQSNLMYDTLVNYETVLAHNNQGLETRRYDAQLKQTASLSTDLHQSYYILNYLQRFVLYSAQHAILLIPEIFPNRRPPQPETYISMIRIYDIISGTLFKSGYIYSKYAIGIVNYETSRVRNAKKRKETRAFLPAIQKKVVFDNVTILHDSRVLLKNLSFEILCGQKVAIVGRNGIGKSTLLKTLLGFTHFEGTILLDGCDFKNFTIGSIRDRISYIHQDSGIFNDTVKYNIAYGRPGVSTEEIKKICMDINIHESISRLEKGYSTIAGERGGFLSGGERQKIAFARAVARNADILILDEPTASLDKHAEADIFKMVFQHSVDKTTFIIVHNLDLLKMFDVIVFLKDIDKREIGTYAELMDKKSAFYEFIQKHNHSSSDITLTSD